MRAIRNACIVDFEDTVVSQIQTMWNNLISATKTREISIRKAAERAGVNASGIYHSLRMIRENPFEYVDNPVDSILALCDELSLNIDDVLSIPIQRRQCIADVPDFKKKLRKLSMKEQELIRFEIIKFLKNNIA